MRWRRRRYVSFIDFAASFHLTTCAGFWQYGTLQWDEFYNHLRLFIVTSTDWSIFQYEPTQQQHGASCPSGTGIVPEGTYILLSTGEWPITSSSCQCPYLATWQLANQFKSVWSLFPHLVTPCLRMTPLASVNTVCSF